MEATKKILDDMDCTLKQKLKGTILLLRDKAYQWWQSVTRGTLAERLTWDYFQKAFQKKYVGTRYVEAHRLEFIKLKQGDMSVAEYKVEFLRLSCYAQGMVATK